MRTLYQFFALLRRPVVWLFWVWLAFMAASLSGLLDGNPVDLWRAAGAGSLSPGQLLVLWRTAMLLPAVAGVTARWVTSEVYVGAYAWTLPRLRRSFVIGLVVVAAFVALPVAIVFARLGDMPAAIAAYGVGIFFFTVPLRVLELVLKRGTAFILTGVAVWAVYQPRAFIESVARAPLVVTVVALTGAAVSLAIEYSGRLAREAGLAVGSSRRQSQDEARPSLIGWLWRGDGIWRRRLAAGRLGDWIRAGSYERFGDLRFGWIQGVAVTCFILIVFSRAFMGGVTDELAGALVIPLLAIGAATGAPVLRTRTLYPLSRQRRAVVTYWASLTFMLQTGLTVFALLGTAVWLHQVLPRLGLSPSAVVRTARDGAFIVMWMPAVLWVHIRYARFRGPSPFETAPAPVAIVMPMLALLASFGTSAFVVHSSIFSTAASRVIAAVAIAALLQGGYWLSLRRHFRRGDLIAA